MSQTTLTTLVMKEVTFKIKVTMTDKQDPGLWSKNIGIFIVSHLSSNNTVTLSRYRKFEAYYRAVVIKTIQNQPVLTMTLAEQIVTDYLDQLDEDYERNF